MVHTPSRIWYKRPPPACQVQLAFGLRASGQVPDKPALALGTMYRYSAQIVVCIIQSFDYNLPVTMHMFALGQDCNITVKHWVNSITVTSQKSHGVSDDRINSLFNNENIKALYSYVRKFYTSYRSSRIVVVVGQSIMAVICFAQ